MKNISKYIENNLLAIEQIFFYISSVFSSQSQWRACQKKKGRPQVPEPPTLMLMKMTHTQVQ